MKNSRLVYSTSTGRICTECGQPVQDCTCKMKKQVNSIKSDGIVRVRRETKGRRGKVVTIVSGFPFSGMELIDYAKELKQKCSAGGSLKDGELIIQGDHCDFVVSEILKKGIKVRKVK